MADATSGAAGGAASGANFGPWGALAGALLGGVLGARQQKEQEEARKQQALINMYAPLFGKAPEAMGMKQDFTTSGALSGLMSGYNLGAQINRPTQAERFAAPTSNAYVIGQTPGVVAAPQYGFNPYGSVYG